MGIIVFLTYSFKLHNLDEVLFGEVDLFMRGRVFADGDSLLLLTQMYIFWPWLKISSCVCFLHKCQWNYPYGLFPIHCYLPQISPNVSLQYRQQPYSALFFTAAVAKHCNTTVYNHDFTKVVAVVD